ncbi:MAG: GNAT family N-acetyltransferase [Bacillota bacterium]
MNDLILKKPSKALADLIWEYRQEYFRHGETNINGSCGIASYDNFNEWLEVALSIEKDKLRNNVHASTFFSMRKSDNKIIGSIQLRHSLTPELEQHGGHIGYGIRPSERKKGYGKQQLSLVLDVARQMGILKVLITCDKENIASAKTAISCGGRLAGENIYDNKPQLIYWIDL